MKGFRFPGRRAIKGGDIRRDLDTNDLLLADVSNVTAGLLLTRFSGTARTEIQPIPLSNCSKPIFLLL
jgi:hypothetical protein